MNEMNKYAFIMHEYDRDTIVRNLNSIRPFILKPLESKFNSLEEFIIFSLDLIRSLYLDEEKRIVYEKLRGNYDEVSGNYSECQ